MQHLYGALYDYHFKIFLSDKNFISKGYQQETVEKTLPEWVSDNTRKKEGEPSK